MCRKKTKHSDFLSVWFFFLFFVIYLSLCLFIWEGQQIFFYLKTCKKVLVGKIKNKHVFLKKKKSQFFYQIKKKKLPYKKSKILKNIIFFQKMFFF